MTTFEQDVLKYLDGSLDRESSENLLRSISADPEKQRLFDQHVKLRDLFGKDEEREVAPLAVQRSLAEKIPVLAKRLPYLAPLALSDQAAQSGFFSRFANSVSGFISQISLSTGLLIGGIIGVGGLAYYALNHQDATVKVVNQAPMAPSESSQRAEAESVEDANKSESKLTEDVSTNASARSQSTVSNLSGTKDKLSGKTGRRIHSGADVLSPNNALKSAPHEVAEDRSVNRRGPDEQQEAPVNAPLTSSELAKSSEAKVEEAKTEEPKAILTPVQAPSIFTQPRVGSNFKPYARTQYNRVFLPRVAGSNSPRSLGRFEFAGGFSYSLSQEWRTGVEGGSAIAGQLRTEGKLDDRTPGLVDYVITKSELTSAEGYWVRVMVGYGIGEEVKWNFDLCGGLFTTPDNSGPTASVSATMNYPLSQVFGLNFGLGFEGVWLSSLIEGAAARQDRVGVNNLGATKSTLFTPSAGIRFGVEWRP